MKKILILAIALVVAASYGYAFADENGMKMPEKGNLLTNGITYFSPSGSVVCSDIGGSAAGGAVASEEKENYDIKDKLTFIGGDKPDPLLRCTWAMAAPAVHNGATVFDGLK